MCCSTWPYFADIGDFANAGDLHLSLRDSVAKNIVSTTVSSFGYDRFLALGSTKLGDGSLLYAGEFNTYNGPWVTSEDVRKFSGLLRYSQGTATDGFSATAMAYTNNWNSSDQVALRAITTGQIGLFGELDPTDGGDTSRFMLSARLAQSDDVGMWKANAYLVKETMDLFNNFTWDTTDPVNGDQFHQLDKNGAGAQPRSCLPTELSCTTEDRYGSSRRERVRANGYVGTWPIATTRCLQRPRRFRGKQHRRDQAADRCDRGLRPRHLGSRTDISLQGCFYTWGNSGPEPY
jgi:hypothetical protein